MSDRELTLRSLMSMVNRLRGEIARCTAEAGAKPVEGTPPKVAAV